MAADEPTCGGSVVLDEDAIQALLLRGDGRSSAFWMSVARDSESFREVAEEFESKWKKLSEDIWEALREWAHRHRKCGYRSDVGDTGNLSVIDREIASETLIDEWAWEAVQIATQLVDGACRSDGRCCVARVQRKAVRARGESSTHRSALTAGSRPKVSYWPRNSVAPLLSSNARGHPDIVAR